MGLECWWNFVGCGAGIKAPPGVAAKARTCLMPDSHNPMCESWPEVPWRLTGLALLPAGPAEPFARRRYLSEGVEGSGSLPADSDQEEIDQRDQSGADADGDQGIVGSEVTLRIGPG